MDAYDISKNYFNKRIKITLNNNVIKYGVIIKQNREGNTTISWKFVSNNNANEYQKTGDDKLTEIILQNDIQEIEHQ